jgi:hypothetical protein
VTPPGVYCRATARPVPGLSPRLRFLGSASPDPSTPCVERVPSAELPRTFEELLDDRGGALRCGGGAGGGVADQVDPPLFEPLELVEPPEDPPDPDDDPEPDDDEPEPDDELEPLGTACPALTAGHASTVVTTSAIVKDVR